MKKYLLLVSCFIFFFCLFLSPVSAHVHVEPEQIGIGADTTFTVTIPTEENIPTTALRLLIPSGVTGVIPNVKVGWDITEKKDNKNNVIEIDWINSMIPVGERDTFLFEAQVPASPTIIAWKAYQIYQDGSVVAWTDTPISGKDDETYNPYATTHVIDDFQIQNLPQPIHTFDILAFVMSIISLCLSSVILIKRKNTNH